MILPVYKNLSFAPEFYIERSLPNKGKILVNQNDEVKSYTKIGYSKDVSRELLIPANFELHKSFYKNNNVKMGDLVAYYKNNYIFAPFDGYLEEKGKAKSLIKYQEDYWSLAGVEGKVFKVVPSRSCLIKTSGFMIKLFATSVPAVEGELTILPNPSELIELDFMEKYVKDGLGKIVYTGDFLRKSMLDKAIEIGCEGVMAGSCDRETLLWARENNFFVGILSGFGRIPTYTKVFNLLKSMDNRYVLLQEGSENLFISSSDRKPFSQKPFDTLKEGLDVVVLDYPFYGWEGEVISVASENVNVKIVKNNEVIKTKASNLIALS